jgi:oxygen-independent coproporphyrinogen-3 oxidase
VNADLIYGSPWERTDDWRASLRGIVEAEPDHVSAYALTVEEGTPLATLVATGRVPDVDADLQAERHEVADAELSAAGYVRYEVSNWARPGHESAHNVLYWRAGDYLGFGAGAHGHLGGRRWWSTRLPRDYIAAAAAGESTEAGSEHLDDGTRAGEAVMLGLRLAEGVDVADYEARFGPRIFADRGVAIRRALDDGLLERSNGTLRATERATMVMNELTVRLL